MIDTNDIKRLCYSLHVFSRKSEWCWGTLPVVVYEFSTIKDFMAARSDLIMAIEIERLDSSARSPAPHIEEIDCNGVTFRLVCREVMQTERGCFGAAEVQGLPYLGSCR